MKDQLRMNVFDANFDNGINASGSRFVIEGNQTPRVVDIAGHKAVEVSLNHYGDANSTRTELQPHFLPSPAFSGDMHARYGQDYTYSLSTYMAPGWQSDSSEEIITQWHDWPDAGETWKNPAVSLKIAPKSDGAHFVVQVRADADAITPSEGAGRYDVNKEYDLGRIDGALGNWTNWSWDIKWGYDNSGDLTLRRDGQVVLDLPNQANCFNDANGPYFKFGEYKWDWGGSADTGADSRTIYFDDVRIDTGASGGGSSSPSGGGGAALVASGGTPDSLVLKVSGDAWQGNATYTVSVDGQQLGGTRTANAAHSSGTPELVELQGNWGPGEHAVEVAFQNDVYGGSPTTDRNLYVEGATYNGTDVPGAQASLTAAGDVASFSVRDYAW